MKDTGRRNSRKSRYVSRKTGILRVAGMYITKDEDISRFNQDLYVDKINQNSDGTKFR